MDPAPTPIVLAPMPAHSLMSSPFRTSRQSLPEPMPATPIMDLAPWPRPSVMSWGPKAAMSRSPEASAVRSSAKRWNSTCSTCTLYFAASAGRSQSGESAGTLAMPCLTLTAAGSGVRAGSVCAAACVQGTEKVRSASSQSVEPACRTFMQCLPHRSSPGPSTHVARYPLRPRRCCQRAWPRSIGGAVFGASGSNAPSGVEGGEGSRALGRTPASWLEAGRVALLVAHTPVEFSLLGLVASLLGEVLLCRIPHVPGVLRVFQIYSRRTTRPAHGGQATGRAALHRARQRYEWEWAESFRLRPVPLRHHQFRLRVVGNTCVVYVLHLS